MMIPVALAVLDPGIGQQQSVAVFLLVGELTIQQTGIELHRSALQHLVAGIDAIDDVQVGV